MMEQHWDEGGYPTMTKDQHALQEMRLQGLGEEPSGAELGDMRWPQRCWWADRVRIGAPVRPTREARTAHTLNMPVCVCSSFR